MDEYRSEARRRYNSAVNAAPQPQQRQEAQRQEAQRDGPGVTTEGDLFGQLLCAWNSLTQDQQKQFILVCLFLLAVLILGVRVVLIVSFFAAGSLFLHGRKPAVGQFEPFFRVWFTEEYFPKVSQQLQRELKERAKSQNLLDRWGSQIKGWMMDKTETLQASAWYELAVKHALPARYSDLFVMRIATVNVGSNEQPCFISFWGINERWMLSPFITLDVDNVSVLDDMAKK